MERRRKSKAAEPLYGTDEAVKPMKQAHNTTKGFTLIELMIYISIVTAALLVFTNFMVDVTHNAAKAKVAKEVQQNARLIMAKMTQEIRSGSSVNRTELAHGKLIITKGTSTITFARSGDDITYDDSADGLPVETLTNQFVKVTDFTLAESGTNGISIHMTIQQKGDTTASAGYERDQVSLSSTIVPRSALY